MTRVPLLIPSMFRRRVDGSSTWSFCVDELGSTLVGRVGCLFPPHVQQQEVLGSCEGTTYPMYMAHAHDQEKIVTEDEKKAGCCFSLGHGHLRYGNPVQDASRNGCYWVNRLLPMFDFPFSFHLFMCMLTFHVSCLWLDMKNASAANGCSLKCQWSILMTKTPVDRKGLRSPKSIAMGFYSDPQTKKVARCPIFSIIFLTSR